MTLANLKIWFFILSKRLGLFSISGYLYRRRLNILCYHGFSYQDEHMFRPSLFVTPETFSKRLQWINDNGFKVFALDEGLKRLYENNLPPKSLAITIDDGFRSVLEEAVPLLLKHKYCATLYVTTYYVEKAVPIFRLVVQYTAWKSNAEEAVVAEKLAQIIGVEPCGESLMDLVVIAERRFSEPERIEFSKRLAAGFNLDYEQINSQGLMSLLTKSELKKLAAEGLVDIQLHTHRHRLPLNTDEMEKEITDNREVLHPIVATQLEHFCYPSGIWNSKQLQTLERLGIRSATTCDPGMNTTKTNPLALTRFLDREDLHQIEFEAELFGYKELLRNTRSFLRGNKT